MRAYFLHITYLLNFIMKIHSIAILSQKAAKIVWKLTQC